jgi:hypothetical protein
LVEDAKIVKLNTQKDVPVYISKGIVGVLFNVQVKNSLPLSTPIYSLYDSSYNLIGTFIIQKDVQDNYNVILCNKDFDIKTEQVKISQNTKAIFLANFDKVYISIDNSFIQKELTNPTIPVFLKPHISLEFTILTTKHIVVFDNIAKNFPQ